MWFSSSDIVLKDDFQHCDFFCQHFHLNLKKKKTQQQNKQNFFLIFSKALSHRGRKVNVWPVNEKNRTSDGSESSVFG